MGDKDRPSRTHPSPVPLRDVLSRRQLANTGQIFLANSLYLSPSENKSGAIAPRLSNNDPCTSNCGKLILDLRAYQTLPGSDDHNFSKSWFFSRINIGHSDVERLR